MINTKHIINLSVKNARMINIEHVIFIIYKTAVFAASAVIDNLHLFFTMPPIRPLKQKQQRSAISNDLKRQICEWSEANKNKTHQEIASEFNEKDSNIDIKRSTVTKILQQKDKWKAVTNTEDSAQTFRHKEVKFPILDRAMSLWVENVTAGGVILTDLLIKEKARIFAEAFNIQENELVFSNGWLQKFKKRNNIRRFRIHGESGSAPLASLSEERAKLHQLLSRFTLDQIYNIDETVSKIKFIFLEILLLILVSKII